MTPRAHCFGHGLGTDSGSPTPEALTNLSPNTLPDNPLTRRSGEQLPKLAIGVAEELLERERMRCDHVVVLTVVDGKRFLDPVFLEFGFDHLGTNVLLKRRRVDHNAGQVVDVPLLEHSNPDVGKRRDAPITTQLRGGDRLSISEAGSLESCAVSQIGQQHEVDVLIGPIRQLAEFLSTHRTYAETLPECLSSAHRTRMLNQDDVRLNPRSQGHASEDVTGEERPSHGEILVAGAVEDLG